MTPGAMPGLPVTDWTAMLRALCSDAPARIGTPHEPAGSLTLVQPTRFPWLRSLRWSAVGDSFGIALLELAEPGSIPAAAWEPLCGPLHTAPPTRQGPVLFGRFDAAGTGRTATLTLVTDRSADGVQGRVVTVRIRIEPAPPAARDGPAGRPPEVATGSG